MTDERRPLVLHVIHHLYTGGMENGLINVIDGLPDSEYRHAIACIEDASEFRRRLRRADVEVVALHRSRVGIWQLRRKLYGLCRRMRPAILHTRNLSGLDALLPGRLAGVRICVHGEHGWDVDNLRGNKWRPAMLRRLHSPLIDRYITVSRDLQRYLVNRVGVAESRITHICNGVDTTRFTSAAVKPINILPPHLRGEGLVVIGTVGRIQAVKDQATLLHAVTELVAADAEMRKVLRVAIVGDGPLLPQLRELANELGIADIAWLPGARDDIPEILRLFDVFVLPSLAEGISNTILEAMASRLPILATGVGGNVEIVEDGTWGRIFSPGDIGALSRLLDEYVRDPALRLAHADAARRAALAKYGLATMVQRYGATYASLLGNGRVRCA